VEETPPTEEPITPAPVTGAIRLTDGEQVVAPILFYQGNGISYFNTSGNLYQTDLSISNGTALLSNKRERSIELKANITRVLWPLAGSGFMAEFNSASSKPSWSYFDTSKGTYANIPSQVYSLDWMPTGDKIIFTWVDASGKTTLDIGDPDTNNYQTLAEMYEPDNIIRVSPDGKNILFYRTQPTDNTKNTINMVSSDGKVFNSIIKDGYNSGVLWAPDSKQFLFTKRDPGTQKFALWVGNITTSEIRNLGVYSSVNKAVWSKDSQSVYVGVPASGTGGQGLSQDIIYKITPASGGQVQFDPGVATDAQDLFLSSNEDILFFRNAQDNALYYISLSSPSSSSSSNPTPISPQ
jgi:hypothetical protein